ncbi:o-succinylbenzoate synthase [Nesterenkonia xinjiangensis]|uniref:o-succinylbenzoate synthase n=1 Tax=Nesterenkonia xinjiangensis TaxID=225327 RepID=A0A7Z0GK51_9MICC|nr:o-succinylbenzoate synthase [Nesterenkonia xinjiangensis]NYJ77492.1 O-succinylbenzoate synthase [Nesterenkonia xinjiangensis]
MTRLPDPEELLDDAVVVRLPMRTRFRGQIVREAMLLRGPAGWAEFAPFPEYAAAESAAWLDAAVEAGWRGLGTPRRTHVPINATMPAVMAGEVPAVLERYGRPETIPAVKIKVAEPGQSLAEDLARIREVARLVPHAGLRVDANGGWSHAEALHAIETIAAVVGERLEYAEQPVAGVEPLAVLREELHRRGVPVRLAADEAVRKAEDPLRVARLGAADLIVVKVPPLGGVGRAAEVVRASGLDAVVSSALDTSIGLAAGLALAARLDSLPFACGLGTAALLAADIVDHPLIPREGALPVPLRDGVVVAPEPAERLLAEHRVEGERRAWWEERLRAAHAVLEEAAS